jgi:hypothetical protein
MGEAGPAGLRDRNPAARSVQEEERQDQELLQVSNQILELTKAIHAMTAARAPAGPTRSDGA